MQRSVYSALQNPFDKIRIGIAAGENKADFLTGHALLFIEKSGERGGAGALGEVVGVG